MKLFIKDFFGQDNAKQFDEVMEKVEFGVVTDIFKVTQLIRERWKKGNSNEVKYIQTVGRIIFN